jgi:hypothetical protein
LERNVSLEEIVAINVGVLAVGLIVGYVKGHADGVKGGRAYEQAAQKERDRQRGQKAAETRRLRKDAPLTLEQHLAHNFYDTPSEVAP